MNSRPDRHLLFEAIAGVVFDPLQRYFRRRLSPEDASDAFAETLAVIWRRLDEVPPVEPLPWCYGVARRVLANYRRGLRRQMRLVDRLNAQPAQPSFEADTDPEMEAAMARLPDADREVLRLWAWEGLGPGELGPVLGVTVNAATLRLSRAKKRLAIELEIERQNRRGGGHIAGERPRSVR